MRWDTPPRESPVTMQTMVGYDTLNWKPHVFKSQKRKAIALLMGKQTREFWAHEVTAFLSKILTIKASYQDVITDDYSQGRWLVRMGQTNLHASLMILSALVLPLQGGRWSSLPSATENQRISGSKQPETRGGARRLSSLCVSDANILHTVCSSCDFTPSGDSRNTSRIPQPTTCVHSEFQQLFTEDACPEND